MSRYDNAKDHMPGMLPEHDDIRVEDVIPVSFIPPTSEIDRLRDVMWMVRDLLTDSDLVDGERLNFAVLEAIDMLEKALER